MFRKIVLILVENGTCIFLVMSSLVDELESAKPDLVLSGFDIGGNMAVTMVLHI